MLSRLLPFCWNKIVCRWNRQKKAVTFSGHFQETLPQGSSSAHVICSTFFWQTFLGFVCSGIVVPSPVYYALKARAGGLPGCRASPRCCTISMCSDTHRAPPSLRWARSPVLPPGRCQGPGRAGAPAAPLAVWPLLSDNF